MEVRVTEIQTKLDPFGILCAFSEHKDLAFLDSSLTDGKLGRYSFMGVNPYLVLKGSGEECEIDGHLHTCNIYDKLSEILSENRIENHTEIPFLAGCIGYLSYDFGTLSAGIPQGAVEDPVLPHYYFVFYDNLILFDQWENKTYISACGVLMPQEESTRHLEERIRNQEAGQENTDQENAEQENTDSENTDPENTERPEETKSTESPSITSNFGKEDYLEAVTRVREYIRAGDIYIANLSQRFSATTNKDAISIYRDLRELSPAPFAGLLCLDGFEVISSSPESFLRIRNGRVQTRPIKGTRPRGKNRDEDECYRKELLESEKDKAELLMIVDLERNDLSKVCRPHSVKVNELFSLEEYSTVFHLVAEVEGQLKENVDAPECVRHCFPGGSITGTPKIRAMEIIGEIEGLNRSLYTGSMGYFSFDGNADFNIMIRTLVKKEDKVFLGAGGGITWDSREEEEYLETLTKAEAMIKALF